MTVSNKQTIRKQQRDEGTEYRATCKRRRKSTVCTERQNQQRTVQNHDRFWSPITIIFTQEDLRKTLKVDVIFARPVPKNEHYVNYHNKPLNLLGFTTVKVKVGERKLKNSRILITRDRKRSLIGRDWRNHLNFRVEE